MAEEHRKCSLQIPGPRIAELMIIEGQVFTPATKLSQVDSATHWPVVETT